MRVNCLNKAAKSVAILKNLRWSGELREKFLQNGKLPEPSYAPVDVSVCLELVRQARPLIDGDNPVFAWLRRSAATLELTAHMMSARWDACVFHLFATDLRDAARLAARQTNKGHQSSPSHGRRLGGIRFFQACDARL